jgi:FMN phosphatase YigB (HAD superfamily)
VPTNGGAFFLKAVLFDLDGTLLQMDFETFVQDYFSAIARHCKKMAEPRQFIENLLASTGRMLQNEGQGTNKEVFLRDFTARIRVEEEKLYPVLEEFYLQEFPKLKRHANSTLFSAEVVRKALAKGWRIVLATNPLFPRLAIEERMRWAGILDFPWEYISTYENSRACKPKLYYYREMISKLQLDPEQCWMVGNDTQEDMVAGQLGFKTYLVTDYLIEKNAGHQPNARGTLRELLTFMEDEIGV